MTDRAPASVGLSKSRPMKSGTPNNNESILFWGFFRNAFPLIFRHPLIALFSILSVIVGSDIFFPFLPKIQDDFPISPVDIQFDPSFLIFLFGTLIIFSLSLLTRTGLILSVSDRKLGLVTILTRARRAFVPLFLLEITSILACIILAALLLAPSATSGDPSLAEALRIGGGLLLCCLVIILFFTRQYAFLHITLSRLSLLTAIRLGYALFRQHMATSIFFSFFSLFVAGAFLSAQYLLALTSFHISSTSLGSLTYTGILFVILALHTTIQKGAWVSFFRYIATPDEPDAPESVQESEKVIQREVPETGNA